MKRSVLVTDAETAPGLTVIRSLGRAGWDVVAVSPRHRAPGLASRYAKARHVVPAFETDAVHAADAVVELARRTGVDLVIPVADKSVIALSDRRADLGDIRLAVAAADGLELARDKGRTMALADSLGIPTPRTETVVDRVMAETVAEKLGYPVVLKPLRSHDWYGPDRITTRSVSYASDQKQLQERLDDPSLGGYPVLLQEYVEGAGVGVELLTDRGRPIAAFQHRRIRSVPLTGGMSASRVSEALDPTLLEQSIRMLESLRWTGLAMVEFRVGVDRHHLLEINGRVWGSIALPVRAGMDFPAAMADLFTIGASGPRSNELDQNYRVGVECQNFELELRWLSRALTTRRPTDLIASPPRGPEIRSVMRSLLDPRTEFDVQSLDDIVPGILDGAGSIGRVGRESVGHAFARFRSRRS